MSSVFDMTPEEQMEYPGFRRSIQLSLTARFQALWLRNPDLRLAELLNDAWPDNALDISDNAFIIALERHYPRTHQKDRRGVQPCGVCVEMRNGKMAYQDECPEHRSNINDV